jgi:hypothetical protein
MFAELIMLAGMRDPWMHMWVARVMGMLLRAFTQPQTTECSLLHFSASKVEFVEDTSWTQATSECCHHGVSDSSAWMSSQQWDKFNGLANINPAAVI